MSYKIGDKVILTEASSTQRGPEVGSIGTVRIKNESGLTLVEWEERIPPRN